MSLIEEYRRLCSGLWHALGDVMCSLTARPQIDDTKGMATMKRSLTVAMLALIAIGVVRGSCASSSRRAVMRFTSRSMTAFDPTNNLAVGNDGVLEPARWASLLTTPLVDGNVRSLSFDGVDDNVSVVELCST